MVLEGVKLVFPPGAVDNPLPVEITLEEPSRYYGLIVQKDLENDVMFGAPIINLQPNGYVFKKPVTLATRFNIKNYKCDDILILHGTEAWDGKITWEDMMHNSTLVMIDETNAEVSIKLGNFSLIAFCLRLSLTGKNGIVSRLNSLAFNYKMSVLLNKNNLSSMHGELALLFVSQDIYNELLCKDHKTSALEQLKTEGFIELHVRSIGGQEEKRIYNNERLQVSVHLAKECFLADSRHEITGNTVETHVWWNVEKVVKLPLKWTEDLGILCGKISVQGEYGHTSNRHFSERGE